MNSAFDSQVSFEDISPEGKARLLDIAYTRLRFGINAMPFVSSVLVWYLSQFSDNLVLLYWLACYCLAALISKAIYSVYLREQSSLPTLAFFNRWLPRIQNMAILHGFGLAMILPLIKDVAPIELKYLTMMTIGSIMAGNAAHQSPVLSIYNRFFMMGWNGSVLLMPLSFPDHWQFAMPLSLIYSVTIFRHARASHRFFVHLVWLEEEGSRMAERYKQAKEQAEAALIAKNQFLTTASHDLRQPINAMAFLVESITHRNRDDSLNSPLLDLKRSVRSITQMFNSLLDLSKIESGVMPIKLENLALDPLLEDVASVYRQEAQSRGLCFRVRHSRGLAAVRADPMLLRQSLINLMQNALRYTPSGGVLMAARRRQGQWQIEIWDTGVGVALEDQNHIYSPFFRNQHAWRIDSAGHGLGLAVVARCANLMEAEYGFQSKEGHGSRFWLRLPPAQLDLPLAQGEFQKSVMPVQRSLRGACLIVDDDPQVCSAWESLLKAWGLEVVCAESSLHAFAALDGGFEPGAIFCDQRLRAGESGFELLCALLERCPSASGAMVSGEFDSPDLRRAENEGYLVLRKPLQPEQLHAVLACWLESDAAIEP